MIIRSTMGLKRWPVLPVLRTFRMEEMLGLRSYKNKYQFKQSTYAPEYYRLYELFILKSKVNERNHMLYFTMLVDSKLEK